jgi:hypothetical protein
MKNINGYGRRCGLWLVCAAYVAVPVAGQQQEDAPPAQTGFSIRETSIYSTYFSSGVPPSLIASGLALNQSGSDFAFAGSTAFGYSKQNERTTMGLLFRPSYSQRLRFSDWSAFNNDLSVQVNRSVTTRLQFTIGGAAALRNREEFQFNPVSTTIITDSGATSPPLPAPGGADPVIQSLFFGSRILTANVNTGIRYMLTPRLAISSGIASNRTQYLPTRRDEHLQQQTAVIPQVTSILGNVGMTYDLSQRTSIGGTFETARQQSRLQNALIVNARVQVQRTLSRHWIAGGYGGFGQFRTLQQQLTVPSSGQLQYIAGGSITFRSYAHVLIASVDRHITDMYGLGSSNSYSFSGSWRWARPTSRFWLSTSFGRTELQSLSFPATSMRGTAEVGRRVAGNVSTTVSFSYMGYASTFLQANTFNQHAVRLGVVWAPGVRP